MSELDKECCATWVASRKSKGQLFQDCCNSVIDAVRAEVSSGVRIAGSAKILLRAAQPNDVVNTDVLSYEDADAFHVNVPLPTEAVQAPKAE